jgi:hypothetical protein
LAPKFEFKFEWGFAARNGHMGAAADQDATLSGSNSEFQVLQSFQQPGQPSQQFSVQPNVACWTGQQEREICTSELLVDGG